MDDLLIVLTCIAPLAVYLVYTKGRGEAKGRFGSIGLGLAFCYFALGHFVMTDELVEMLPSFIPQRELVIYATGVAEVFIAIGLFTERWRDAASIAAAFLLVTFLPANIYAASNYIGVGDHKLGPDYLWIRIPLQLFLLGWALWPVFWPEKNLTRNGPLHAALVARPLQSGRHSPGGLRVQARPVMSERSGGTGERDHRSIRSSADYIGVCVLE